MDAIQRLIDGFIDFEGQRLSEVLTTNILLAAGIVGWIVGFVLQDVSYIVYIGLAGSLLAVLVVIPPWPIYNKHPLRWLPAGAGTASDQSAEGDGGVKVKKEE
ncbi:microsomal signal peptidase 12 kDa subunit-domain-containing protein [Kalaharituber pfeilii]|nr:microsomal signal peptidase 12 kDa subunit-domain-containing protein [Kalaharituber pfeilii]